MRTPTHGLQAFTSSDSLANTADALDAWNAQPDDALGVQTHDGAQHYACGPLSLIEAPYTLTCPEALIRRLWDDGLLCEVCEARPWTQQAQWHHARICADCAAGEPGPND